jgi:23S rRNA (adenine2503-C2)-methyltransferase
VTAFSRTIDDWVRELAPFGKEANVRRALRSLYRLEASAAWELPELGADLARELERQRVRADLPLVHEISQGEDGTEKLLVAAAGGKVETVLIPEVRREASMVKMNASLGHTLRDRSRRPRRAAGCISTQLGCAVGCTFCASGLLGLARNLTASELVGQVLLLRGRARARGHLLATVVFMGMGEPLHNTDELVLALTNLTDPWGAGYGASLLTVSTVGVTAGMERLARLGPRAPNLALSLHAPDDATRARIIPLPRLPGAREALQAGRDYARATRRFVTVSYVLLDGVNDSPEQADELSRLLEGSGFHVNLIPWNAVPGLAFAPSPRERAQAFWERLRARGTSCHFRKARGAKADAACGQLRRRDAGATA